MSKSKAELKPGQFANRAHPVAADRARRAGAAASAAHNFGATYVFVIKNGHAEQRLVQSGQTEGDLVDSEWSGGR